MWSGAVSAVHALLDLVVLVGIAIATLVLWSTTGGGAGPIQVLLGVPFVLVLPGYALTCALFPGVNSDNPWSERGPVSRFYPRYISGIERIVLSVGLSIFVVPLLGLFLNFTPWGVTAGPYLMALLTVVVGGALVAAVRRLLLPAEVRFVVPVPGYLRAFKHADRRTKLINVVIGSLLVLSLGVAGGALAAPGDGEQYTEFYLLTQNETSGELVSNDYPSRIAPGTSETVQVGIENQEARSMEYTMVVEAQRIEAVEGERLVVSRSELDRYQTTLEPGESTLIEQEISAGEEFAGERVRLTFMLYTTDVGSRPDIERAYRTTHIWIDFTAGGEE